MLAGAVCGAGLLSGGELVAFFGGANVFCLMLSALTFFIGFAFGDFTSGNAEKYVFLAADAVFSAAMISGLDDILGFAGILKGVPVASALSIIAFHFLLSKNVKSIERLNCVLIPVSVAIVLIAVIIAPAAPITGAAGAKGAVNAVLYACMNVFVALPPVKIAAKNKSKRAKITAALCFSAFFMLFAYLILRVSPRTSLPLLDVSYGTPLFPLLIVAIFIGSFTSLVCYLYPLKEFATEKAGNKKTRVFYCVFLYIALFLLSRVGLNAIIKYLYPVVGALGASVIIKGFVGIKISAKGDTNKKRSALCPEKRKTKSKNLPKKNTATI